MEDRERICSLLKLASLKFPSMRIGQIIENAWDSYSALNKGGKTDLFYTSDADLLAALKRFLRG